MSSNLKVNTILPSTGSNVAIGTAGGTVTMVGNVDIDINSGISTFNDIHVSDKIVHDGDTNTAIRFPAADTITAETGGSERLRIDSSGRLGVGVNSFHDTSTRLQLQSPGSDHTGIVITAAATSTLSYIYFGDTADKDIGRLVYENSSDSMQFWTNNAERLRINSSGQMGLGTNNPVQQAGRGLHINGTDQARLKLTNASSGATANDGIDIILENGLDTHILNHENGNLKLGTNDAERVRITSAGQLIMGTPVNTGYNESAALISIAADTSAAANMLSDSSAIYNHTNPAFIHVQNRYNTGTGQEAGIIFHSRSSHNGSWAIYGKRTGSSYLSDLIFRNRTGGSSSAERFKIDSNGWTYHNTTYNGTTNGVVDKRYNWGSTNNLNFGMQCTTRQRFSIWEHRQIGRTNERTAQMSCGENGSNQGIVYMYSSTANADVTGGVNLANGATSWSATSDMRLKNKTGDILNALEDINKIEPLKFTWKYGPDNNPHVGVSAQSVENVVPEAIERGLDVERQREGDETEYMQVRYTELIPLSIAAIKELITKVETLEQENIALRVRVTNLEGN